MKKKEFKIAKHSTTNEDYQLVKELLPHCRETIGVDFFDSAGNLQLSLTQSGRIISKAIILTVKLTRHHYRDWIEEKINLLDLKPSTFFKVREFVQVKFEEMGMPYPGQ